MIARLHCNSIVVKRQQDSCLLFVSSQKSKLTSPGYPSHPWFVFFAEPILKLTGSSLVSLTVKVFEVAGRILKLGGSDRS